MTYVRPSVLLLHGFWHGSWCWAKVNGHLAALGVAAVPVDMIGHGLDAQRPRSASSGASDADFASERSPLADVTLDQAVERLAGDLRQVGGGRALTVVAHSMGGAVLTATAERHPELVANMVYLCAFMPAHQVPSSHYISSEENAGEMVVSAAVRADPAKIGALRIDPWSADPAYLEVLRQTYYGDLPAEAADAAIRLLGCDAPVAVASTAVPVSPAWGRIPRTYIRCGQDYALRPRLQTRFIAEADRAFSQNPTKVVDLDASHSPFLSMPKRLAEIIAAAAA